jgi:hypothetical protein
VGGWKAHILGILFSAALLSLGAPFWYNALKNLASLRSTVAQNISKEQEQALKQPDEGKPQVATANDSSLARTGTKKE